MKKSHLYIVATPIGNLGDLTQRAIDILNFVDVIAAEDTRHSKRLLDHYAINKPMLSLHEYNEESRINRVAEILDGGGSVALISDAGTPLISDPGYHLVKQLREKNYSISPIPGPCAFVTALSVCGLPTDSCHFLGFLPAKRSNRLKKLEGYQKITGTLAFYESPHRIVEMLEDVQSTWGDPMICIAREITKTFETIKTAPASQILEWMLADANQQKGEFVVLVESKPEQIDIDEAAIDTDKMLKILLKEVSVKTAAQMMADITGQKKKGFYQRALAIQEGENG